MTKWRNWREQLLHDEPNGEQTHATEPAVGSDLNPHQPRRPADAWRYPTVMTDRKPNAKIYWWIGAAAVTCVLFFRGQHLLGRSTGIVFATTAFAIAVIGYRNLCMRATSRFAVVPFSIFAVASAAIMFSPATFSPDVQHFINKQATDRSARAELTALLQADADYTDIKIATEHLKVVFVSVTGSVPSRQTIDGLLADLSRLEFVRHCSLHGRVVARDTGVVHEFTHHDLNAYTDKIAGNHAVQRSPA